MIQGLIVALLTPFHEDESINYEACEAHIDSLIAKGIEGLFILGSNGEFHALTFDEKVAFAKHVIRYTANRVNVYVGIGCNSTRETIQLAQAIAPFKPTAFSVITPYFLVPSQEELIEHYQKVAESTEVPLILYNIPKNTGMNIEPSSLEVLLDCPGIVGIKDSSGNMENLKGYVAVSRNRDFSVLVGSDSKIYEAYALGAVGAVCGTANVICEHDLALIRAIHDKDFVKAQQLQKDIDILRGILKRGTTPVVLKRCVTLLGIDMGVPRRPVKPLPATDDDVILEVLRQYHLK